MLPRLTVTVTVTCHLAAISDITTLRDDTTRKVAILLQITFASSPIQLVALNIILKTIKTSN